MNWHDLEEELKKYVTVDRFSPIEKLVWGITWLVISSVVIAGLAIILRKP